MEPRGLHPYPQLRPELAGLSKGVKQTAHVLAHTFSHHTDMPHNTRAGAWGDTGSKTKDVGSEGLVDLLQQD